MNTWSLTENYDDPTVATCPSGDLYKFVGRWVWVWWWVERELTGCSRISCRSPLPCSCPDNEVHSHLNWPVAPLLKGRYPPEDVFSRGKVSLKIVSSIRVFVKANGLDFK